MKNKKSVFSVILVAVMLFAFLELPQKAKAASGLFWVTGANIATIGSNDVGLRFGKTGKVEVADSNGKILKGSYTWSVSSPNKQITIKSGKESKAVTLSCSSKNALNLMKKSYPENPTVGKLSCVIKNKKKKVIFKKSCKIYAYQEGTNKETYVISGSKTVSVTKPNGSFCYWGYAPQKGLLPSRVTASGNRYSIYPKLQQNFRAQNYRAEIYFDIITDTASYCHSVIPFPKKWATIIKSTDKEDYACEIQDFICGDSVTNTVPSTVKKNNYITIGAGSDRGVKYQILSGKNLLKTMDAERTRAAGDISGLFKKYNVGSTEVAIDKKQSNVYMAVGGYKCVKKGKVKIKVTFADKTTKIMNIKIK